KKNASPLHKGIDTVYFGEFPNGVPKITYAASMGIISLNEEDRREIKNLLRNFQALGIREVDLMREVKALGYTPQLVLDPVFLLGVDKWKQLYNGMPSTQNSKKYVLVYDLNYSDDAKKLAAMKAKELGCEVRVVLGVVDPYTLSKSMLQTETPEAFLSLISRAEFIVTTSFHGTAFSIIFNKQFLALGMGNNSQRTKTLLGLLGIENRYIDDIETGTRTNKIDYRDVNNRLANL